MLGEAIWSLKYQDRSADMAKKGFFAVFWTFLEKPKLDHLQNALKCMFSHARFTGAIGLDASFRRGLARRKTRSVGGLKSTSLYVYLLRDGS